MGKKEDIRDREICCLLNRHDEQGMELLFEVYYVSLVSWANTFLNDLGVAEDVVQELFIALWNREIRCEIKSETLPAFLRVVVRNRCYNRMTRRDVFTRFTDVSSLERAFEEYDDSKDHMVALIMDEIALLPPRSREILHGVFVEGWKYQEVAEHYGISVSTVKTLLGTSIRKLRKRMRPDLFAEFLLFYCLKC